MTARARLVAFVLAGLPAIACGGEANSEGAGASGSGGNGGTSGSVGVGGSQGLDITVLDPKEQPIAGAIVVVDELDGTQLETTTDALGVAKLAGVDLATGTVDLTVFSPGHVLVSVLGVGPTSSKVIHLRPPHPLATQEFTVHFSNKVANDDCVALTATPYLYAKTPPCGDSVEIELEPGATGKLLAIEHAPSTSQWAAPPIKAALAVDIPLAGSSVEVDFSKSLPIEHASGSFDKPGETNGFTFNPSMQLAFTLAGPTGTSLALSSASPGAGPAVDWQADFFRPLPDSEVSSWYGLGASEKVGGGTIAFLGVSVEGYPEVGAGPLPPFPIPTAFASLTSDLFAPIAWVAIADRPDRLRIHVLVPGGTSTLAWDIWFPAARDSVTLRKPPESIWSALEWQDAELALASLSYCQPAPGACGGGSCAPTTEPRCARYASSIKETSFDLKPP